MKSIIELTQEIRGLVNKTRKSNELSQDRERWHKMWSSIEVIEDTDSAIDAFSTFPDMGRNLLGEKYLRLYGVLQALSLSYERPETLLEIREVRDYSIGHPTKIDRPRQKPVRFASIIQVSIENGSYEYLTWNAEEQEPSHRAVDVVFIAQASGSYMRRRWPKS